MALTLANWLAIRRTNSIALRLTNWLALILACWLALKRANWLNLNNVWGFYAISIKTLKHYSKLDKRLTLKNVWGFYCIFLKPPNICCGQTTTTTDRQFFLQNGRDREYRARACERTKRNDFLVGALLAKLAPLTYDHEKFHFFRKEYILLR